MSLPKNNKLTLGRVWLEFYQLYGKNDDSVDCATTTARGDIVRDLCLNSTKQNNKILGLNKFISQAIMSSQNNMHSL